jgi:hypothetical protein
MLRLLKCFSHSPVIVFTVNQKSSPVSIFQLPAILSRDKKCLSLCITHLFLPFAMLNNLPVCINQSDTAAANMNEILRTGGILLLRCHS